MLSVDGAPAKVESRSTSDGHCELIADATLDGAPEECTTLDKCLTRERLECVVTAHTDAGEAVSR